MKRFILLLSIMFVYVANSQTVTDYDGNVYDVVEIGTQSWLKQNLNSLHYSDGTSIPDVKVYNNNISLAEIYGRLYTWDAAMRNSSIPQSQGVCPEGWHVPSHAEWSQLEEFLGGASVAGGEMKETGFEHWNAPNTGATNSSGFTALPGGEYDAYYTPNIFQMMGEYAVFWTSTETSSLKARERYLSFNNAASSVYDWFKVMNYSIRCIKDASTGMNQGPEKRIRIFPNPACQYICVQTFNDSSPGWVKISDRTGRTLFSEEVASGNDLRINISTLPAGIYFLAYQSQAGSFSGMFCKVNH